MPKDQHDAYERILQSLHAAALDETHWEPTSALIDEACGSKGNLLVLGHPRETSGVLFARLCYRGQRHQEWERDYYRRYEPVDEHLPRLRCLADSRIAHVTELFTDEERKTSPAWNEAMAVAHFQDSVHVRLDDTGQADIFWSLADPVDAQGWSGARTGMIARLLPHVRHFLRVRHALVQAEALGLSLQELLGNERAGIVQLDRSARIVAANDLAVGYLRAGEGLFDEGGRLCAVVPQDHRRLWELLLRAIPPFSVPAAGGSMAVTRPNGLSPLAVHVSSVQKPATDFRSEGVAALVIIVDAHRQLRIDPGLVAAALGLTRTESEVAVMLARGMSVRDIAAATPRKEGTIRSHVKQIFAKQGLSRQTELVRLVLALAVAPQPPR